MVDQDIAVYALSSVILLLKEVLGEVKDLQFQQAAFENEMKQRLTKIEDQLTQSADRCEEHEQRVSNCEEKLDATSLLIIRLDH
ncbi:hypothetical protein NDU88_001551 [Pleurodeles waltl]|uniref:Uncharacterized protein n=1 Tax=Pleurodeles waltl TaxID=8319 RepID=A0AAV7RCY3_PLEWA|nr:hypothetical protein NDU88_001551 [Pleurodeles waltl]